MKLERIYFLNLGQLSWTFRQCLFGLWKEYSEEGQRLSSKPSPKHVLFSEWHVSSCSSHHIALHMFGGQGDIRGQDYNLSKICL